MLPGIAGIGGLMGEDPTFLAAFIGYTPDTTNLTTYTFLGVDIGVAHGAREVFLTVNWAAGITARTISSATIGGVPATVHRQQGTTDGVSQSVSAGVISAAVSAGTAATVVITFSGGALLCVIGTIRVQNRSAITATAADQYSGANPNNPSTTIDVGTNGVLIGAVTSSSETGGIAWTGITETYEDSENGGTAPEQTRYSGALSTGLSLQAARPVSTTQTSGSPPSGSSLVAVSIT